MLTCVLLHKVIAPGEIDFTHYLLTGKRLFEKVVKPILYLDNLLYGNTIQPPFIGRLATATRVKTGVIKRIAVQPVLLKNIRYGSLEGNLISIVVVKTPGVQLSSLLGDSIPLKNLACQTLKTIKI